MRQLFIVGVIVLILLWGLGIFLGYLAGLKSFKLPPINSTSEPGPSYQENQRRIASESEDSQKKVMQDYRSIEPLPDIIKKFSAKHLIYL